MVFKSVCLILGALGAIQAKNGLDDGHVYEIISHSDHKVLSVPTSPGAGDKVSLESANDESNQKWLAVATDSDEEKFFLLPKRQTWDWHEFTKKSSSLKHRGDSLPEDTLILTEDRGEQSVLLQRNRDKSSQKWRAVPIRGKSYFLIKNVGTDRCLKNTNKKHSFFSKVASQAKKLTSEGKRPRHTHPETVSCDKSDKGQQWELNPSD